MDKLSELLKNQEIYNKLIKTSEGENLAIRITNLNRELELLPDIERVKFQSEFGDLFNKTLTRILKIQDEHKIKDMDAYDISWIIGGLVFTVIRKI